MLQKRLTELHSSKHDVSTRRSLELEELNLLIRCCMLTLTFSVPQKHLLESGRVLLLILKKLTLLEVAGGCHGNADSKKSHSCQCIYSGGNSSDSFVKFATLSSLELFDSCIPSITLILEVVIDELLLHGRLRKYLQMIDSYSPVHERLFKEGTNGGDFGVMMDMICSHFSLSISDEGALQEFLNRITRVHFTNSKSLELSVIAARTLLHNPVLLSSPKLIQAHVVSLVSNVISIGMDNERLTPDPKLVDCCLSVFESSVRLYTQHMSILKTKNHSADSRATLVSMQNKSSEPSFDYCTDPTKRKKLNQKITTFNDSWNSSLRRKLFKNKSNLLASSFKYIQDSCIIDRACKHEIVEFMKCILVRAANDVNDIELPLNGDASLQDICLLASLLMLMSISLRQSLKNLSFSKQYNSIVRIINCFKDFSVRLPIQVFAYNIMETNPTSHNESRMMLFHFLGLLSLSFDSGLDFLVNGCISVIIGLTDLFFIEEDNIDALRSLAIKGSPTIKQEAQVFRHPTLRVAAKFQKIQKLYLSNDSAAIGSTPTENVETENLSTTLVPFSMRRVTSTVETCNGELYLKNILKGSSKMTDLDDLADFVECTKGKEYDDWLKGRAKFRKWIKGKWEIHGWERKKRAWRSMSRNTRFRSKHHI
uniref:uncharacterized protein LOC122588827 n=1 Tax=Erigeron canadensis TaxID=72917 RepID=UPI001CB910C8|nr:uncharacterized protein LOC122588827 [Erigeron canadensis]